MSELTELNAAISETLKQFDAQIASADQELVAMHSLVSLGCRNDQNFDWRSNSDGTALARILCRRRRNLARKKKAAYGRSLVRTTPI